MKTCNINIYGNVRVVRDGAESALADDGFRRSVSDPAALDVMRRNGNPLTADQKKILECSMRCAYTRGVSTFGLIREDGEYVFVNTCPDELCPNFGTCSSESIFRKIDFPDDITPPTPPGAVATPLEPVGSMELLTGPAGAGTGPGEATVAEPRTVAEPQTGETCGLMPQAPVKIGVRGTYRHDLTPPAPATKPEIDEDPEPPAEEPAYEDDGVCRLENVESLMSPEKIISSPADSHILVNSGPGTGKTYSVIERLKYIVKKDGEEGFPDPGNVLVLCFSRSAVRVIRDRLSKAMDAGEIGPAAREFQICTFDSFATWYMRQVDADKELGWMDYDRRIEEFIRMYANNPGILNEELRYLIVDEIQDLVGVRAALVQTLLSHSDCGFLLLGDICQAIYDYQMEARRGIKASDLYRWIENTLPGLRGIEIKKYELKDNMRAGREVAEILSPLRDAMLNEKEVRKHNSALMDALDNFRDLDAKPGKEDTVAYLYRSNLEAFRKSRELYAARLDHDFLAGTRRTVLRREIADVLCGYDGARIVRDRFLAIGEERGVKPELLAEVWDGLACAVGADGGADTIGVGEISRALTREKGVADCLTPKSGARITVSTIHKAKGSEYDFVYLRPVRDQDKADEIKVYYVALTRARKNVLVYPGCPKEGYDQHRIGTQRRIAVRRLGGRIKIIGYELGMDGDIDPVGFVDNTCGDDVAERQRYIAEKVKRGDRINVFRMSKYYIMHNGRIIGTMNDEAFEDIGRYSDACVQAGERDPGPYRSFTELYVRDVVTVAYRGLDPRIDERYAGSGVWYGVDFCGLAKPME